MSENMDPILLLIHDNLYDCGSRKPSYSMEKNNIKESNSDSFIHV